MNKKELKQSYKLTPKSMGIFQVRNLTNEKVFIGKTENLTGMLNRQEFQLKASGHPNKKLQADYSELGADKFSFEILEELEQREGLDLKKELDFLEDLWLEKLQSFGENGYNEPKKTREQRLQMIAANRKV